MCENLSKTSFKLYQNVTTFLTYSYLLVVRIDTIIKLIIYHNLEHLLVNDDLMCSCI